VVYFDAVMVKPLETLPLKPFTQDLLARRPDLQVVAAELGDPDALMWQELEADAEKLVAALAQLVKRVEQNIFLRDATVAPPAISLPEHLSILGKLSEETVGQLLATTLFRNLNDQDIRVTRGHFGTTPFEHIAAVVEWLVRAQVMNIREALILLFTAIFHDSGKGLSSGVGGIDALMKGYGSLDGGSGEWKGATHSHPDHASISEMMLRAVLRTEAFSEFAVQLAREELLPVSSWQDILLLIRHHHGFEKNLTADAEKLGFSFEQVVLLFYFKFADACSTPAYRKDWPRAVEIFREWLDGFDFESKEVSEHARELAEAGLGLRPNMLEGGDK
jgi:hypothetical protein